MATKPKKNARYDLNAADRRRNLFIQIGLTAIVVLLGVGLVLYIVMGADKKPASGETKSIRVSSSKLITKEGTTEPKAVVSLYEDFLCPHCGDFEQKFGPTINQLIDSGADRGGLLHGRHPGLAEQRRTTPRARAAPPTASPTSRRTRSAASTPRCTRSSPERPARASPTTPG